MDDDASSRRAEIARWRSGMLGRRLFVLLRHIIDVDKLEATMLDHYRWLTDLEKQGVIVGSGPAYREDGRPGLGVTILRAEDFDRAKDIAASDPFCRAGAAKIEVQRWELNFGRVTVSIDFSDQSCRFE